MVPELERVTAQRLIELENRLAAAPYCSFTMHGHVVAVEAPPDGFERFANAYFPAVSRAADNCGADARVSFPDDGQLHSALSILLDEKGQHRFADSGHVVFSGFQDTDFDESTVIYVVRPPVRRVLALTSCSARSRELLVMRMIRSFYHHHLIEAGWSALHGAACAFGDEAVLILGAKGAGKTTTLVQLTETLRSDFISNDNIYVRPSTDGLMVAALPKKLALRAGTLECSQHLREGIQHLRDSVYPIQRTKTHDVFLTPNEFCSIMGTCWRLSAKVAAVIFPTFDRARVGADLRTLDAEAAVRHICANRLDCHDQKDPYWSTLFTPPSHQVALQRLVEAARSAVRSASISRLEQGPGAGNRIAELMRDALNLNGDVELNRTRAAFP